MKKSEFKKLRTWSALAPTLLFIVSFAYGATLGALPQESELKELKKKLNSKDLSVRIETIKSLENRSDSTAQAISAIAIKDKNLDKIMKNGRVGGL